MAAHFISHRTRRRKRRRRAWAIVRGLFTFATALPILLAAAWLNGDLKKPATAPMAGPPLMERRASTGLTIPAPILAPLRIAGARSHPIPLYPTGRVVHTPREPDLDVLSTYELATISQAH